MAALKWIVCGGRVGRGLTKNLVWSVLDTLAERCPENRITVVHGGAVWVDTWAGEWAKARGHLECRVEINGELDGYRERAPMNRNRRMLQENIEADRCLGFPGGGGTNDMMEICHKAGIPVGDIEVESNGDWELKWWPQK